MTDYNTKISDIEKKITDLTTPELNRLTTKNFKARIAQADLAKKNKKQEQQQQILTLTELVTELLKIKESTKKTSKA